MKPGDYIFVYGTLRKDERANRMMRKCEYMGEDRIVGRIYDLGSFPGMKTVTRVFNTEEPIVVGDVYQIPDEDVINALDYYEGYPSLYNRIVTYSESGMSVWVYVFNGHASEGTLIESGDWKHRVVNLPCPAGRELERRA